MASHGGMLLVANISPRFGGGSGLKQEHSLTKRKVSGISPRFGGGSGLKQAEPEVIEQKALRISPRFGGGSGLKLCQTGQRNGL